MKQRILLAIALVAIIVASALVRTFVFAPRIVESKLPPALFQALHDAPSLTLYSLDPHNLLLEPLAEPPAKSNVFHDFRILGQTSLSGNLRDRAVRVLEDAMSHWNGNEFNCFEPRHGIRVTLNDASYDLVICFQCRSLEMYAADGKPITQGLNDESSVFNELLTADHVPLPSR